MVYFYGEDFSPFFAAIIASSYVFLTLSGGEMRVTEAIVVSPPTVLCTHIPCLIPSCFSQCPSQDIAFRAYVPRDGILRGFVVVELSKSFIDIFGDVHYD